MRIFVSASTTFVLIAGPAIVLSILLLRRAGQTLDFTTFIVCVLLGTIAAAQDIRASYRLPPIKNGNLDSYRQLLKLIETETKDENENKTSGN